MAQFVKESAKFYVIKTVDHMSYNKHKTAAKDTVVNN